MHKILTALLILISSSALAQYSGPPARAPNSDSPAVDAFGRFRVSAPMLLFESKLTHDRAPLTWSEWTNATGAIAYSNANSAVYLSVQSNGIAIRQTRTRFAYQPGKSQHILMTGVIGAEPGTLKRIGYFTSGTNSPFTSELDGIFFQMSNGVASVNIAKYLASTSSAITSISQTNWNLDAMDGKGPSKQTVNWNATQIFVMDFEWLGVGSVRFGLVIDGNVYYVHRINNANTQTSVYMRNSNHPLRYEIRSLGGSGTLQEICATVNSEGGEYAPDIIKYLLGNQTPQTLADSVTRGLIGIRLNPDKPYSNINIIDAKTINPSGNNVIFQWLICLNPTYTNAPATTQTWSAVENSAMQISTNFVYITDPGTILSTGYGSSASKISEGIVENALRIGMSIDGELDELWLVARKIGTGGNNPTIIGALGTREVK
jgi:hypothetical protein